MMALGWTKGEPINDIIQVSRIVLTGKVTHPLIKVNLDSFESKQTVMSNAVEKAYDQVPRTL